MAVDLDDLAQRVDAVEAELAGQVTTDTFAPVDYTYNQAGDVVPVVGFTPSYACVAQNNLFPSLVQDPGDPYTWWFHVDGQPGLGDTGQSEGWTTVDHLGSGKATMLVPPDAGAFAIGASVTLFWDGITDTDYGVEAGPCLIGGAPGSYYTELAFHNAWTNALERSSGNPFATPGFAPEVGADNLHEVGFGWFIWFDTGTPPTHVRTTGWGPALWAHKAG